MVLVWSEIGSSASPGDSGAMQILGPPQTHLLSPRSQVEALSPPGDPHVRSGPRPPTLAWAS